MSSKNDTNVTWLKYRLTDPWSLGKMYPIDSGTFSHPQQTSLPTPWTSAFQELNSGWTQRPPHQSQVRTTRKTAIEIKSWPLPLETDRLQIYNRKNKQFRCWQEWRKVKAIQLSTRLFFYLFLVIFHLQPLVTISKWVGVTWPDHGYYGYFHLHCCDVSQELNQIQLLRWALVFACVGVWRQENGNFPGECDGISRIA